MLAQVRQLAIQPVVTARAQPLRRVAAVAVLRAEIQLYRQLYVMHAVTVAQQHIQFAQCLTVQADRQVGGDDLHARRVLHCELPESFVITPQTARGGLRDPVLQLPAVLIQFTEEIGQSLWRLDPVAPGQWMALRPRRGIKHGRRQNDPRKVAHLRVSQLTRQVDQIGE